MGIIEDQIAARKAQLSGGLDAKIAARKAQLAGANLKPEDTAARQAMRDRIAAAKAGTLEISPEVLARQALIDRIGNPAAPGMMESLVGMGGRVSEGATLGLYGDEAKAAVESAVTGQPYDLTLQAVRRDEERLKAALPKLSATAEIAGGMVVPGLSTAKGATMGAKALRAAVSGGLAGLGYGFAEGEGTANRFTNAGIGGALGAVGGAMSVPVSTAVGWAARKFGGKVAQLFKNTAIYDPQSGLTQHGKDILESLGYDAATVSDAFKREFAKNLDIMTTPQEAATVANMAEFGIPAYRANVTGSVSDFAEQARARAGVLGTRAEAQVGAALDRQAAAARGAADNIATGLGGNGPSDQWDAAVGLSERVKALRDAERAAAKAAYQAADAAGFGVKPEIARDVAARIQTKLADNEVDTTLGIMPETRAFMSRLSNRGQGNKPVSLALIDGLRKDVNAAMSKPSIGAEDMRALKIVKDEYDAWLDDVVTAKLFSGDEKGVESLKEARGLWMNYAKKFMGKDAGSKFIQDMIDSDASPDQVSKWLFSSGQLGTGRMTSTVAKAVRDLVGDTSEEWGMVRQAAFRQLTQKPEGTTQWGPQKVAENILKFANGTGTRDLSRTLFSQDELMMFRRYASALQKMVAPAGAVNTSATAYETGRMVRGVYQALAGSLGFASSGGVPGAGLAASTAMGAAQKGASWLKARAILNPALPQARNVGALASGVGVGAGMGTSIATTQYQGQRQ